MGHINLTQLKDVSPFRKAAMGTWNNCKDPQVYSLIELDITGLKEKMDAYGLKHGVRITLNHLIGKAYCGCIKVRPEINGLIRGSKIYLRESVSLNYLVNVPGKDEDTVKKATLSSTNVRNADNMTVAEIAKDLEKNIDIARKELDPDIKKNMDTFAKLPWCFMKFYLNLASWLIYGLNIGLGWLGIPKDPFGSVMITNVGSLGVDMSWAPLVPYSRVPVVLTVCSASAKAWVVDGQVVPRLILPIGVVFDHRFLDGIHGAQILREIKKYFNDPDKYFFND